MHLLLDKIIYVILVRCPPIHFHMTHITIFQCQLFLLSHLGSLRHCHGCTFIKACHSNMTSFIFSTIVVPWLDTIFLGWSFRTTSESFIHLSILLRWSLLNVQSCSDVVMSLWSLLWHKSFFLYALLWCLIGLLLLVVD